MDAKVKIQLSEAGQKDALARGLSAEREQTISVPAGNGDLKYFSVDSKGDLSLNLISSASAERQWSGWSNLCWHVYPSAEDILDFLRTREAKRAAVEETEREEKEQKEAAEQKRRTDAYAKFCALGETEQEDQFVLYYKYVTIDTVDLKSDDYPAVAAAYERKEAKKAAAEEKAKLRKQIPAAPRADRGVQLAADGKYEITVPSGSYEKEWSKHVTSVNAAQRGGYAIEGPWLKCGDTARLVAGEMVAVGSKEWQGSKRRGGFATSLDLYIVTPAGLVIDRNNNEISRAADLLALTAEERVEESIKKRIEYAVGKIDALAALDRIALAEETATIDERLVAWRDVIAACERALQGADPESNISDVDSAAAAIVAAGYRELAKKNHPDAGGAAETMALLNAAKKQLVEILNAAREVK